MSEATNEARLFPYPKDDPARLIGFVIGDIVLAGIFLMLVVAIFPTLIR